jgi:hypothetical protein
VQRRREENVFELEVRLDDVTPAVWRRLLVPGTVSLAKLHDIFQAAMGWDNAHLHSFRVGDALYGTQIDDYPEDEIDESTVSVAEARQDHQAFSYEYDFGDSWEHHVVVVNRTTVPAGLRFAVCLGGESACPPEDCGGSHGYALMLEAIVDPSHEEHGDYLR